MVTLGAGNRCSSSLGKSTFSESALTCLTRSKNSALVKNKKEKIAETVLNQAPKIKISSPDYQIFIDIPEIDKKFH